MNKVVINKIFVLILLSSTIIFSQYNTKVLYTTLNSDLPSNYISDYAEDKNGKIWLSTLATERDYDNDSTAGIAMISETEWKVYTVHNSGLPQNSTASIALDSSGNIWAGTWSNGLVKFDQVNWSIFDTSNTELPSNFVWDIEVDSANRIWISLPSQYGVAFFSENIWNFYNSSNSEIFEDDVSVIKKLNDLGIVIGTEGVGTVSVFDGSTWTQINCDLFGKIVDIEQDNLGGFWCSAQPNQNDNFSGLRYINSDRICIDYSPSNIDYQFYPSIGGIELDKNNNLWIANIEGLVCFDGENWYKIDQNNSPIPGTLILSMHIDIQNNIWMCVSEPIESDRIPALGLFIISAEELLSYVTNVDDQYLVISQFQLRQNFPNPFNPTTTINFTLPTVEQIGTSLYNIQLIVYDILGNKISTLVNGQKSSGMYTIEFDGSPLANGVYFYQLKADKFISTKKMILIK